MIKYRQNPGKDVSQTNVMQIATGLPGDQQYVAKQYKLVLSGLGTFTSITAKDRNGNNVVTPVSGVVDRKTLREALVKAINGAGGLLANGGLEVTNVSTTYTIIGTGDVPLVSLENGATRTFTVLSTPGYSSKLKFLLKYGEDATITVNGTTSPLGDITAATATADIKDDVDAATGKTSTVTHDPTHSGFIIEFTTVSTASIFVNGVGPYQNDSFAEYTA